MKKLCITAFLVIIALFVQAQDFQCQVTVSSAKIAGSNRSRFDALEQELRNFINDRKWCLYTLKLNERIECGIMINLEEISGDVMTGTMTVQLQRPVYKSSYKSTILNFQDKDIQFSYAEGEPLEYADNANLSSLTSLIAFYLNLFMGMDFDTFSLNGGATYINKCQSIINLNQGLADSQGWKMQGLGQRNRYWLIENLTNGSYSKIHDFLYQYHRLGLDVMSDTPDLGRSTILESLRLLQEINSSRPNLFIIQVILLAKADEIINIFKEGTPAEKTTVVTIMKQLDPSNSKYNQISQTN